MKVTNIEKLMNEFMLCLNNAYTLDFHKNILYKERIEDNFICFENSFSMISTSEKFSCVVYAKDEFIRVKINDKKFSWNFSEFKNKMVMFMEIGYIIKKSYSKHLEDMFNNFI